MSNYLRPLWIFLVGQLGCLVAWLFIPALGVVETELVADTAVVQAQYNFWNWSWAANSLRFLVIIVWELCVIWAAGKAFVKGR